MYVYMYVIYEALQHVICWRVYSDLC